jgi:kinesin family protein 2/24
VGRRGRWQGDETALTVHETKLKVDLTKFVESHTFRFDEAFSEKKGNREIYVKLVRPLVEFVREARGGRATCFAYGQTVSHTLS